MVVHLFEQVADHRPGMVGMKRGVPLECAEEFLLDSVVVGVTLRAQAGLIDGFGSSVKSAEHGPPISSIVVRGIY